MFDSVLVTVSTRNGEFSMDLDIPSQEPIGELKTKLLEILRMFDDRIFGGWLDINIVDAASNKRLMMDETLEDAEIWDGSILYVMN